MKRSLCVLALFDFVAAAPRKLARKVKHGGIMGNKQQHWIWILRKKHRRGGGGGLENKDVFIFIKMIKDVFILSLDKEKDGFF